MATAIVRSALRGAVRGSPKASASKRTFSSSANHDDAREAAKWEKISYAAAGFCTIFAIYNLSKEHPHYDEAPKYSHMHIRNKEFPWGPDGLFERKHH